MPNLKTLVLGIGTGACVVLAMLAGILMFLASWSKFCSLLREVFN